MAQSFDQHAIMTLDLLDPLIYFIESTINSFKSLINSLESLVNLCKLPINPLKPFFQVLNEFLIHATSAVKLNSRPFTLSCQ